MEFPPEHSDLLKIGISALEAIKQNSDTIEKNETSIRALSIFLSILQSVGDLPPSESGVLDLCQNICTALSPKEFNLDADGL